ncbi:MAG: 4Fe-4S dicluster domain-containing protein [Armatimonadetes bacterium]|nr:4Fe-4S dicluster domain-containing protein [Armatimonadota bacterium]NIO74311.1 4Fe-4S dicluster domain-containing protein [Armatimonadota bacterium]NIO95518.1 4Fe-4S dicluster domain-containing protein [Armatimonadota bacterium]
MATAQTPKSAGKGHIIIDVEKCKACELCIHFCPQENLALSESINARGFHPVRMLDEEKCNGCGNCALMCPDVCIRVFRKR